MIQAFSQDDEILEAELRGSRRTGIPKQSLGTRGDGTRGTCHHCRGPINHSSLHGRNANNYCCYGCLSLGESTNHDKPRWRFDGFAVRIGIGMVVAAQSMIFGLAINIEEQTPPAVKWAVQSVILGGTVLVAALLGPPLFRNTVSELRRGRLTVEALFLLTMGGAVLASLQSFISGRGPIYFEVVTVLLVVYALGKAIGAHRRAAAMTSTRAWADSLAACRVIDPAGNQQMIEIASIAPGDCVEVRPGEKIPVDGLIREGFGFVGEAPVSGEPFPVVRRPGDRVLAGALSHDATFRIEATAAGTERQIDRLLEAVESAQSRPASVQAQADRLARVFVPLIIGAACLTFTIWTIHSGWQTGLFNAMSVLLVACPCAIGLATPIILWSTLNRLAERGLIVRGGDLIERLAQVDSVYFDKTGTLTDDQFTLVDIATVADGDERVRVLGWLSLIEERSNHPLAKPFSHLPRPFAEHEQPRAASLRVVPGCGIEGEIEQDGTRHHIRAGRPEWIGLDDASLLGRLHAKTGRRIDFEIDGTLAAIALVAERFRDSVPETLAELGRLGLSVHVLTGDTQAERIGMLPVSANLLPEDKRQRMVELKNSGGRPMMIGDGINDASALATAHVGIALAGGTDLANGAATATLYGGDLRVVPWAIAASRQAMNTVRRNLLRTATYNLAGIVLAGCGVLHPIVAALLMVCSSLLVLWSSVQVGVEACGHSESHVAKPKKLQLHAAIHALGFALQGLVWLLLFDLTFTVAIIANIGSATLGLSMAWLWRRWSNMPHWLDMTIGMLTLGNLGMLLGWWADNGFTPLASGCCECATMQRGWVQPWMSIGMLVFASGAMFFLLRRPPEMRWCKLSMFGGGNFGMVAGMLLGGWLSAFAQMDSVAASGLVSFVGMTAGMVVGMLLGTELTWRAIGLMLSSKQKASL